METDFEKESGKKQEVPQINQTNGLSYDYINEVFPLVAPGIKRVDWIREFVKKYNYQLKRYEERFPEYQYENVVNDQNRELVARINALVDEIKAILQDIDTADIEQLFAKCQEISQIIHSRQETDESSV